MYTTVVFPERGGSFFLAKNKESVWSASTVIGDWDGRQTGRHVDCPTYGTDNKILENQDAILYSKIKDSETKNHIEPEIIISIFIKKDFRMRLNWAIGRTSECSVGQAYNIQDMEICKNFKNDKQNITSKTSFPTENTWILKTEFTLIMNMASAPSLSMVSLCPNYLLRVFQLGTAQAWHSLYHHLFFYKKVFHYL